MFVCLFGVTTHANEEREREREKSHRSPLLSFLPSGRTNERGKERRKIRAKNNDSGEKNENERERENEKKKKPRARAKQKKRGLSAAKEKR